MKKKLFFATVVALIVVVVGFSVVASAASRNYSDWFDLDRINAIDVDEDLRDEATREEVALLIAELCDELELLPSSRVLEFDDDDDFMSSASYKMITRLSSLGIVAGYPDGTFGPENDITRAEALAMILRTVDFFNLETDTYRRGSSFTDTEGHWAEVYCDRAYEQGLVSGRGNGRFYPDDDITREEVITILVNLMGESNNPLICAIDAIYDLEFDNAYYEENRNNKYYDDDRYYNDRYYDDRYYDDRYYDDDDYEERTERPVVNTGSSSSSSNSSSNSSTTTKKPERPVVDTTTNTSDKENTSISDGSKPARPVVDTTISSNDKETTSTNNGSKPARPVVDTTISSNDKETTSTNNGSTPARPVVDTTAKVIEATDTQAERPNVDVETVASSKPARPTV